MDPTIMLQKDIKGKKASFLKARSRIFTRSQSTHIELQVRLQLSEPVPSNSNNKRTETPKGNYHHIGSQ